MAIGPEGIVTEGITLIFFLTLAILFFIAMFYSVYKYVKICKLKTEHNYFYQGFYLFTVLLYICRFVVYFTLFYIALTDYEKLTPDN